MKTKKEKKRKKKQNTQIQTQVFLAASTYYLHQNLLGKVCNKNKIYL
jgi:hypothetical protein